MSEAEYEEPRRRRLQLAAAYREATEYFEDASEVAGRHFAGHEMYAVERLLGVIARLALEEFYDRHQPTPEELAQAEKEDA